MANVCQIRSHCSPNIVLGAFGSSQDHEEYNLKCFQMCGGVRENSKDCQIGLTTNGQMQAV